MKIPIYLSKNKRKYQILKIQKKIDVIKKNGIGDQKHYLDF
jgi:hypothetical protein